MTPQEKAKEIRNSFIDVTKMHHPEEGWIKDLDSSKRAAIIAVDEIINFMDRFDLDMEMRHQFDWWREVKTEIEKL